MIELEEKKSKIYIKKGAKKSLLDSLINI